MPGNGHVVLIATLRWCLFLHSQIPFIAKNSLLLYEEFWLITENISVESLYLTDEKNVLKPAVASAHI